MNNHERQTGKSSDLETHVNKAVSLCCCVEVYQPWTLKSFAESALYHLKASEQIPETESTGESIEYNHISNFNNNFVILKKKSLCFFI